MKMDNASNNTCSLGEDILAYVYDDLSPDGRERFETHLERCDDCVGELAQLSEARYAVYEWKTVEFAPLATPEIRVPIERESVGSSWLGSLKAAFAWNKNWAFAGGLAAVLLAAVFGIVVLRNGETDVAGVEPVQETASPVIPSADQARNVENIDSEEISAPRPAPERVAEKRPGTVDPKRSVAAKVKTARPAPSPTVAVRRATPARQLQESATLGEYTEDRDDSLRLTDIFDDIGSRELD